MQVGLGGCAGLKHLALLLRGERLEVGSSLELAFLLLEGGFSGFAGFLQLLLELVLKCVLSVVGFGDQAIGIGR